MVLLLALYRLQPVNFSVTDWIKSALHCNCCYRNETLQCTQAHIDPHTADYTARCCRSHAPATVPHDILAFTAWCHGIRDSVITRVPVSDYLLIFTGRIFKDISISLSRSRCTIKLLKDWNGTCSQ